MRNLLPFLAVGFFGLAQPVSVSAQVANAALGQAKSRLACGAGVVVSSVFLPNGSLQVTCARNPVETSSATASTTAVVQATGLVAPTALGVVGAVTVLVVIVGGGDPNTTTTTTTSTGSYGGGELR